MRDLVLQRGVLDIVADSAGEIETFAIETSIADQGANLIGKRLQFRIVLNVKVRQGDEKFAVGLHLYQRSFRDNFI